MRQFLAMMLVAVLALGFPGAGSAFTSQNGLQVFSLPQPGTFEVILGPRAGPRETWCAAGDFVYRGLQDRSVRRIYLLRGSGPSLTRPGFRAIQFSTSLPAGATEARSGDGGNYSLSLKKVGFSLPEFHARSLCSFADDVLNWEVN